MSRVECLPETALWPATNGEELEPAAATHLLHCEICAGRVAELCEHRRQLLAATASTATTASHSLERWGPVGLTASGARPFDARDAAATGREQRLNEADRDCPAQIGPYTVVRRLRVGGQAAVYLAKHPLDKRDVAVKWAHATWLTSPGLAERFTDESRLWTELKDPRLVPVHDLGIAGQRPYLVLEYVRGCELRRYAERPFSAHAAVRLMAKLARTLHAVHQTGRLHLDVQPDNILIDADGEPRLIDFGASMRRPDRFTSLSTDMGCGTPEYMSPEQLAGQTAQLGVPADVYALGAVLYELLTGVKPQPEMLWTKQVRRRSGFDGVRQPPAALMRLCHRALSPDPLCRPSTAMEFALALERFDASRSWAMRFLVAGVVVLWCVIVGHVLLNQQRLSYPDEELATREITVDSRTSDAPFVRVIEDLLRRAVREERPAILILADGRVAPLNFEGCVGESEGATIDPVTAIQSELLSLPGTNLLVVTADGRPGTAGSGPGATRQSIGRLPSIPPQALIRITPNTLTIFSGAANMLDQTCAVKWSAVQDDLRRFTVDYEALAFRTSAGSSLSVDGRRRLIRSPSHAGQVMSRHDRPRLPDILGMETIDAKSSADRD